MTKESFDNAFEGADIGVAAAAPMIALRRQLLDAGFPADIASDMCQEVLSNSTRQVELQIAHIQAYTAVVNATIAGVDISHINKENQ